MLCVTGSIAAYRAAELCRLFVKAGLEVQVAMTPQALRFVGEVTMAGLSRRPVLADRDVVSDPVYPHIDAARAARIVVVAPCSANTLARLANGLADNVVCESVLAAAGPLLVAPAMNVRMWEHPATAENREILERRGYSIVGPDVGSLAEGEVGAGRMASPEAIASAVQVILARRQSLAGIRVLVSAGGTREPLDPVRFLGNRSSGRMGVALADAALRRGAIVTTLCCNVAIRPRGGAIVETPSALDLEREMLARAPDADVVIAAAAVADFRPARVSETKRGREGTWLLELEPTRDILAAVGSARRQDQVLVGFAAETGDGVARAAAKRQRKGVDVIVVNDVSRTDIGFDVDDNEVTLVGASDAVLVQKAEKRLIAESILDRVEDELTARGHINR